MVGTGSGVTGAASGIVVGVGSTGGEATGAACGVEVTEPFGDCGAAPACDPSFAAQDRSARRTALAELAAMIGEEVFY